VGVAHVSVGEVGGGLGGAEVGRMDCAGRQGNVGPGRRRDSKFEIRKCAPRWWSREKDGAAPRGGGKYLVWRRRPPDRHGAPMNGPAVDTHLFAGNCSIQSLLGMAELIFF
jgi:hypothetical protein